MPETQRDADRQTDREDKAQVLEEPQRPLPSHRMGEEEANEHIWGFQDPASSQALRPSIHSALAFLAWSGVPSPPLTQPS